MLKSISIFKMSKSWEISEICATRTTAAGVEQVLVFWRPTWEPLNEVRGGAVWDAWVREQAIAKKQEEKAVDCGLKRTDSAQKSTDIDDEDDKSEGPSNEEQQSQRKKSDDSPDVVVSKAVAPKRIVSVKIRGSARGAPFKLAAVEMGCKTASKVVEATTAKRGRGRPRKNLTQSVAAKK
jgi:hypothetical protein